MLFNISNASIDVLRNKEWLPKKTSVSVLRLDKIHPVVSGNKLFKLHYFLQEAGSSSHKTILTFGGAYSNHLVATAYACQAAELKSIAIVRGEQPAILSPTLLQCIHYGMQLKFISREEYDKKEEGSFISNLHKEFGDCTIVPEGGYHINGARGAALIWKLIPPNTYSHIFTATGTATTLAGVLLGSGTEKIVSVPVLKGMTDIEYRISFCGASGKMQQLQILNDYHFGGYAKKTPELLAFMNSIWEKHQLPTDFVYTGKLFFAVNDLITRNYFPPGSRLLLIHSGGLQGNASLTRGTLIF